MQRLLAFLATVTKTVLAKFKRLAVHVLKHPLSSIWWAVKMYFALMFFSLFVACSFGAFASTSTPTGTCAVGSAIVGVGCAVDAAHGQSYSIDYGGKQSAGRSPNDALSNLIKQYTVAGTCQVTGKSSTSLKGQPSVDGPYAGGSYWIGAFTIETTCNWTVDNPHADGGKDSYTTKNEISLHSISIVREPSSYYCPNENPLHSSFLSLRKIGETHYCIKPFDTPDCFTDPKYSIANQFHFSQADAGKGFVCVIADNGQRCPFKELDGGNGVFAPDATKKGECTDPLSDPTPPPTPPLECTTTGSGFKVCKDDPNAKCTADKTSNALICGNSCGYVNGEFMCFTQKDPENDPNKPDPIPRPPKNDEIDDPQKPISSMVKSDFKQIQRGVETRLDGFAADMANLMKGNEYAASQANKNTAHGNKLLNSINQNTADTVKELKKLSEPGDTVEGIEKPEFEDKNDWKARNFGTVMKAKGDEIMKLPLMTAIDNFFDVSFSGSCPTYSVSVWVFEINIDQFCSQQVQALFPYIKAVVLLMCSFFAIRIALL